MVILDLETDNLYPEVTKIHCAVAYDIDKNEFKEFTPDTISDLPAYLDSVEEMSCHNGAGFDLKVLKKLLNYEYKGVYRDTLLMCRVLWPDIEMVPKVKGPHSIEAWGVRFGRAKPVHEDWSVFTPEMLHRCKEDTKIQAELYNHIENRIKELSENDPRINFDKVWAMEHKVWELIEKQADHGWLFDLQYAYELIDELETTIKNVDDALIPKLPMRVIKPKTEVCVAFTQKGAITAHALNWIEQHKGNVECLSGNFCKVEFERMNLGSDSQVKDYLLSQGWKPTEYNVKKDRHNKPIRDKFNKMIKTSPKTPKSAEDWDKIAELLGNNEIKLLAERNKASHRLSQIRGWVDVLRPDHRIEAQANTCSTNTTRMAHRRIVNVPKAKESVYYGKQMRSLFIVPEGKVLVGADASALEARCEAHYIYPYDKDGAMELIEGDIHTKNMHIFGTDRDKAKNGKYCLLYGGSAPKLAETLGRPKSMAEQLYEDYWNGNPGLKQLKLDVEASHKKWGYLLSIDKRPLTIRYKHALINTLFQSCGSIIMKVALCIFDKRLKERELDCAFVGNFHDEIQVECWPKDAEEIGILAVKSMEDAGRYLNLNVPITGEYKFGINWALTH